MMDTPADGAMLIFNSMRWMSRAPPGGGSCIGCKGLAGLLTATKPHKRKLWMFIKYK